MPRRFRFSVPLDTCLFSPFQLQPEAILRLGMTCLAESINRQLMEWRLLKRDAHTTVVTRGATIDYCAPFNFFSAATLEVETGLTVRKNGMFLALDCLFQTEGKDVARLHQLWRPVRISESAALDAVPTRIEGALLERFQADEIDPSSPPRILADAMATLEREGSLLAERAQSFRVSRADCEIADQWQNVRLPGYAAQGRELLAMEASDERLKLGVSKPISALVLDYQRPMYFNDEGEILTRAYAMPGSLVFHHEVRSVVHLAKLQRRSVCGVVLESFDV